MGPPARTDLGPLTAAGTSLGVDVSLSRGLDLVLLDRDQGIIEPPLKVDLAGFEAALQRMRPAVVAIDAPPAWAESGASRPLERRLAGLGIAIFPTPEAGRARRLHAWMGAGFEVFKTAATLGYELYTGRRDRRLALEVFPHASAVTLLGEVPSRGSDKAQFRRRALTVAGLDAATLATIDQLDAALCALTGLRFLEGRSSDVGDAGGPLLVLPVPQPAPRYVRALTGPPAIA